MIQFIPAPAPIAARDARSRRQGAFVAVLACAVPLVYAAGAVAAAADWKPEKRAEIVVTTAPGGGNDKVARLMQKVLQDNRLMELPPTVVNKPGGAGVVALNYLNQHAGDGHYLAITSVTFLAENISGRSTVHHTDVTPIALLFNEYVGFAVRTESKIKSGRDLMAILKADPGSVSAAISGVANHNHIALALVMRAAGGDVKKLKVASFNSGGEAMTAALGGHVDVVVAPFATLSPQVQGGRLRMIGITAPRRVAGPFSNVPNWREQGANAVISNWRVILGPRGMTPPQIAYWESVLARVVDADDWKIMLEKDLLTSDFMRGGETRDYLKSQYDELKSVMTELGFAKPQ